MQMTISKHILILILITIINVTGHSQKSSGILRTILNLWVFLNIIKFNEGKLRQLNWNMDK